MPINIDGDQTVFALTERAGIVATGGLKAPWRPEAGGCGQGTSSRTPDALHSPNLSVGPAGGLNPQQGRILGYEIRQPRKSFWENGPASGAGKSDNTDPMHPIIAFFPKLPFPS